MNRKSFTLGLLLGLALTLTLGAATDNTLRDISNALQRIAKSCEIIAQQRNRP